MTKYYSLTFTKTLWVERDESDPEQAGKDWKDLSDDVKDEIMDKAIDEINCGDAFITAKDLTDVDMVTYNTRY